MNEDVVQVVWSKWKSCIRQCRVNVSNSVEQVIICLECNKYINAFNEDKFRLDMVIKKKTRQERNFVK